MVILYVFTKSLPKYVYAESAKKADDFVFVEGGTFQMGGFSYERHEVTVNSFYISKYEVSQSEFKQHMRFQPSIFKGNADKLPIENINWYDAIDYCNRRSISEGLSPCYTLNGEPDTALWGEKGASWNSVACDFTANGYRLPTEAEWEYAARGGNQSKNYIYSGGNALTAFGWFDSNSKKKTNEVKKKKANELKIYDMSGNVMEWCWDWYGEYGSGSVTNPTGKEYGTRRVLRGGCWYSPDFMCKVTARYDSYPEIYNEYAGFRLVRSFM